MVKKCHKLEPRTPLLWKRAEWPCMGSGSNCLGFLQEHTHWSLVQRSRVFITNSLTRLAGNQHLLQAGPVGVAQGPHGSISAAMINSEPLQLTSPLRSWRGCRAWSCHCCGWMWNVRRARGFREKQAKYFKVTLPPPAQPGTTSPGAQPTAVVVRTLLPRGHVSRKEPWSLESRQLWRRQLLRRVTEHFGVGTSLQVWRGLAWCLWEELGQNTVLKPSSAQRSRGTLPDPMTLSCTAWPACWTSLGLGPQGTLQTDEQPGHCAALAAHFDCEFADLLTHCRPQFTHL